MHRTSYLALILIFAAALSGCHIESSHPLSDPNDAKTDERLAGTWIMRDKHDGEIVYLHIGKGQHGATPAIWVAHQRDGGMRVAILKIIPTEIGKQDYASVQMTAPNDPEENEMGYFFVKYSVDRNHRLTLWDMDLSEAIRSGRLKADGGKVGDSTSRLRAFIQSADPNELFPSREPALVFEKERS